MAGKLQIKLVRGLAGKRELHKRIVTSLGLGKPGSVVEQADTPVVRGQLAMVSHLVEVTEIVEAPKKKAPARKKAAPAAEAAAEPKAEVTAE